MSIQNYSRADRKAQIIMTIALSMRKGAGDELTMYRIARAIGMQPSMHVARMLAEMVAENKLNCRMVNNNPGKWDTFYYRLAEDEKHYVNAGVREIVVKKNGKQVGQLELF